MGGRGRYKYDLCNILLFLFLQCTIDPSLLPPYLFPLVPYIRGLHIDPRVEPLLFYIPQMS
jgi:hypothetical protein